MKNYDFELIGYFNEIFLTDFDFLNNFNRIVLLIPVYDNELSIYENEIIITEETLFDKFNSIQDLNQDNILLIEIKKFEFELYATKIELIK